MKVLAFNGSPRKNANTATLLKKSLEGARQGGAIETEIIHLYDLNFTGCRSCFACKKLNGNSYGQCAVQDGLTQVIEEARKADVLIFGSPIYFGNLSGEMRSFLERLLFAAFSYDDNHTSLWPKKVQSGIIYTLNRPSHEQYTDAMDYSVEFFIRSVLGNVTSMYSLDTYQFTDYSQYYCPMFDEPHKRKVHETTFPQDCEHAFNLGYSLVKEAFNNIQDNA